MTKKELIEALVEIGEDRDELKKMSKDELESMYEDYNDTSSMHPNESYEEFMEHEDF